MLRVVLDLKMLSSDPFPPPYPHRVEPPLQPLFFLTQIQLPMGIFRGMLMTTNEVGVQKCPAVCTFHFGDPNVLDKNKRRYI